jgi:signal transduction histidine kinase
MLPRLEESGLTCSLNLSSELPEIPASAEHLERAFLNLLDNAAKFTPAGGTIRVSAERSVHEGRSGVLVRVTDTGVGIPSGEQVRIFDRFYQVDPSARRRYGGMGLGLSLVRSIVEAHRGAVWVNSEPGRGSTFFVWLSDRVRESSSSGRHLVAGRPPSGRLSRPVGSPDQTVVDS